MYRMITEEINPIPNPAIRRPSTKRTTWFVEAIWRIQPMLKTTHPAIIVKRRPTKSATSPAMRAPKKVPQERIEVMSDLVDEGRANSSLETPIG